MGEEEPQESAAEARNWLNEGLNANNLQRRSSIEHYGRQMEEGRMDSRTDITSNVVGEGAMAQALHMVGNHPDRETAAELRKKVDALAHRSGKTCVDMGGEVVDMRTWGKKSAAESRVDNNGLTHGVVPGQGMGEEAMQDAMLNSAGDAEESAIQRAVVDSTNGAPEEEAMQQAMAASTMNPTIQSSSNEPTVSSQFVAMPYTTPAGHLPMTNVNSDESPAYVVQTREAVASKYATGRKSMSKDQRKQHTAVTKALSKPYDNAYINTLKTVKETGLEDMVDTMLDMAEDMS